MKKLITVAVLTLIPLLSACNTMEGAGEDLQRGGEKLERSANENKNY